MHELSIADAVVRIASDHACGRRVTKVTLKVGHLRQVVPSALEFGFELVAHGTTVEGAELEIEDVQTAVRCRRCGGDTALREFPLQCGRCESFDVDIVAGEELFVESLELEEWTGGGARRKEAAA
jgi:hydrogenase nickel incorporation protein HypA/HybF